MTRPDDDPLDDPAWRAHLVGPYGLDRLVRWAREVRWFRICRATPSPFLTEPDRLLVSLGWRDERELAEVLEGLGLDRSSVARPAWHDVGGHRAQVRVVPGRVEVSVSGAERRRPRLVEADVDAARAIESSVLAPLADRVVDPPVDDRSCLSPARYARLLDGHR